MFCKVSDYSKSKLKDKKYQQKILLKSYKTEINIHANPGLAKSSFEQPVPGVHLKSTNTVKPRATAWAY